MTDTLTIDGVAVYYKGNIKNGALVFIHGCSLNSITFKEQFRYAAFPVLAIDLPGHGRSNKATNGEETYNIPAYARVVAHIITELELVDFILVGHSLGGNVAIEVTALLPGLKGLLIVNTSPFSRPPRLDKMCRPNPFLGYLLSGHLTINDALALAAEMLQSPARLVNIVAGCIMEADSSSRLSFAASLGLDKFKDEFELLHHFGKPLAILQAKNDPFVNRSYLNNIEPVSLWKNGIIELEAGHLPQMEIPHEFNRLMEEFYHYAQNKEQNDKNCPSA